MALLSFADRLGRGETLFTAWINRLPYPLVAETLAREPWDVVTLDMQHGLVDYAAMVACIDVVTRMGKPAAVRIPLGEFGLASRALDAGASAVIAPMINNVADARAFAGAVKFPPTGARSWGPARALALAGMTEREYLETADRSTFAFAMIETVEALAHCDAILAVPGIDGVFVGPSDLSVTLSQGAEVNPLAAHVDAAMKDVLDRATAVGKPVGVYAHTPERARELAGRGFRFIALASDGAMLAAGSTAMWKTAKG